MDINEGDAMVKLRVIGSTVLVLCPALSVWADGAPAPPPPMGVWIGKAQFGFLDSHGNSNAESINGNVDMIRHDDAWKNEVYVGGLYGKSSGVVSAERWETRLQSNYTFSDDVFAFGGLRYEHDLFDGFQYQASATAGVGEKFINTVDTKLTGQIGAGYRRLRPEIIFKDPNGVVTSRQLQDASGEAIGTAGLDFSHALTKTTVLTDKFLVEAGSSNTLLHDEIAVNVKMSDRLALSVGYGITDNTHPPGTVKKLDTVATVNLVSSF
jgi:putative salt-induced outer membrane protein